MIFDTGQPHGVIQRGSGSFRVADFAPDQDCIQIFLTWSFPSKMPTLGKHFEVVFDIARPTSSQLDEEQVWLNGAPAAVCPETGRWYRVD